jgi:hypothetical protein
MPHIGCRYQPEEGSEAVDTACVASFHGVTAGTSELWLLQLPDTVSAPHLASGLAVADRASGRPADSQLPQWSQAEAKHDVSRGQRSWLGGKVHRQNRCWSRWTPPVEPARACMCPAAAVLAFTSHANSSVGHRWLFWQATSTPCPRRRATSRSSCTRWCHQERARCTATRLPSA